MIHTFFNQNSITMFRHYFHSRIYFIGCIFQLQPNSNIIFDIGKIANKFKFNNIILIHSSSILKDLSK